MRPHSKSPLKSLKFQAAFLAVGYYLGGQGFLYASGLDAGLKFERYGDLGFLHDGVWTDSFEKGFGVATSGHPLAGWRERQPRTATVVYGTESVIGMQSVKGTPVYHRHDGQESVAIRPALTVDEDAPFAVEEPREILIGVFHLGSSKMLANSGDTPCPARKSAEGQSRTKQGGEILPGVCNEQVPAPKGKVCSELLGNQKRSAETTDPVRYMDNMIPRQVTNCYHRTLLGTVRYLDPVESKTGDLHYRTLQYNGRPFMWDRLCPSGYLYMLNNEDIHLTVDPDYLFSWSPPLQQPYQLAYNRICGIRLVNTYMSRMFSGVISGWTA